MLKEMENQILTAQVEKTGKEIFEEGVKEGRIKYAIGGVILASLVGLVAYKIGKKESEETKRKTE